MKAKLSYLVMVSITAIHFFANATQNDLDVFSLNRYACEGTCPVYQIDFYSDGTLVFDGRRYVSYMGKKEIQLKPEVFKQLKKEFLKLYQMSLKQSDCMIIDSPSVYLSLNEGGFITKFRHTGGCGDVDGKHTLWEMIEKTEGLLSIEELTQYSQ